MSIPKVIHAVKPQDFIIRPITVNKLYLVQKGDLYSGSMPQTSSGYRLWEGLWTGEKLKLGTNSESTYPTNSFDGTYKHLVWKSIDAQYYRFPYDKCATLEHANKRFTKKFLNYSASIISIPYLDFGESIKPGSVEITGSNFYLTDDCNGNLYDVSLSTGSYSDRHNLIAYWGFNNEFRSKKNLTAYERREIVKIEYESSVFESDIPSVGRNISFVRGVLLNNTGSGGCAVDIISSSIITDHRDEFNFSKNDDFTISFWARYEPHKSSPSTIISKNTVETKQVIGVIDKPNQNGVVLPTYYETSSTSYNPTPIYPYRFEVSPYDVYPESRITFKRSDGTKTLLLSGSFDLDDGGYHHFATVKSGSLLYLYQDGTMVMSGSDVDYHPINNHSLVFGADSLDGQINSFMGNLDEIRIYNKGLSAATIATLADDSNLGMYQSSIVGNVFYRSGKIVISSFDPKHNQILNQNWTLKYKGTHTIYEYETMVRIKKGNFNHTTNKTWLKAPNSDLIRDEATGSLLRPYFTQINLFDTDGDLVAIGKMNQPIQLRDDVDINVAIKWHG